MTMSMNKRKIGSAIMMTTTKRKHHFRKRRMFGLRGQSTAKRGPL